MFAALDLAKSVKVHLVERSPTIGGHMAQLDKTFPTMDCSACIITPKMVEVRRNPNIDLLTYAEIESTEMNVGNFHVKVRQKARRDRPFHLYRMRFLFKSLPVTAPNEWDMNLSHRSAAYIPFLKQYLENTLLMLMLVLNVDLVLKHVKWGQLILTNKMK